MTKNTETSKTLDTLKNFDSLPNSAFVRLPVVAALFGCCPSTVWEHTKKSRLPKPKKLGPRMTGWNVGELRAVLGGTK